MRTPNNTNIKQVETLAELEDLLTQAACHYAEEHKLEGDSILQNIDTSLMDQEAVEHELGNFDAEFLAKILCPLLKKSPRVIAGIQFANQRSW
jgi:hypothetical protein